MSLWSRLRLKGNSHYIFFFCSLYEYFILYLDIYTYNLKINLDYKKSNITLLSKYCMQKFMYIQYFLRLKIIFYFYLY